ncbi:sigma 54-interacting transcriptional regulator [Mariniflexile jejuense]|uniref:Sigma 54-interacting transcriptional regulator n=1 Tax=Mariniflexile jejuense TaxID=1173582 RepID=A0ABW3JJC7_9FLAO
MNKKTVLIVDDTYENLYLLKVILEEAGFNVVEAYDGREGLKMLHQNGNVDLIISDILMPIMDGYLFCQACKKEKLFKNIPFIFYTSTYTEKLDEDFALKLGAAQFLRKPIDHDQLLFVINEIFDSKKAQVKYSKKARISEGEVLKLYSERLINKLEQKSLDLGQEVMERKRVEQLLIHKNEILDLIAINTPLNIIFDKILLNYQSIHPEYFGSISLLDIDGIHINLESAPSMPEAYNIATKKIAIGKNVGSCGAAAFTKKPVIVSDISNDALWKDYKDLAKKHNLKSCWSLPIISQNNELLGTFAIYSKSINTPSLDDIQQLNFSVSLVTIAIEKLKIVTEIKKKDEAYKALINQVTDPIITFSLDGTIHEFNSATYTNLGYSKKEFSNLKIQNLIVGNLVVNEAVYKQILKGKSVIFIRQLMRKDKSIFDVEISAKLHQDGRIVAIARDITERQNNLKALKTAKEFSENLVKSLRLGLVVVNNIGEIIDVNPEFCKMLGFKRSELVGIKRPFPYWFPDHYAKLEEAFCKTLKGVVGEYEFKYIRKNGECFPVALKTSIIKDDKDVIQLFFATIEDISERKKAEKKLQLSEKSLTEAQKIAKIGSYNLNLKTQKAQTSISFNKIVGVDANAELTFFDWRQITHPEDTPTNQKTLEQCIKTGEKFDLQYRILTNDKKELKWIHGLGEVIYEDGEAVNFFGTIQDITERKLIENEIAKTNAQLVVANKELNTLRNQLEQENIYLRNEINLVFNHEEMVYGSLEFSKVLAEIEKVAPTTATVLLQGESGTGKELLARAIHNNSLRNNKPLIKVNCSAIPRELMESELFGHKKGSFTGAISDKAGKFELADGGTLFLDEIGELPLDMQPKILRFLQEGEIEVVGGTELKKLDVRVIAATNRNLKEEIEKKLFREDLFFRLNVFPLEVPPLRKRKDDIPLLVEHFVDKFNKAYTKNIKYISDEAMSLLKEYEWPGNIRELENLIERASILATNETLIIPGFESESQKSKKTIRNNNLSLDFIQKNHILQVLEQCNWKISGSQGAAVLLDLKPSTLRDKMTKLNIVKPI